MNPPLRSEADRQALVEGLRDGTLDCIATDHAPHTVDDKKVEYDRAAPGIVGLETAVALCLDRLRALGPARAGAARRPPLHAPRARPGPARRPPGRGRARRRDGARPRPQAAGGSHDASSRRAAARPSPASSSKGWPVLTVVGGKRRLRRHRAEVGRWPSLPPSTRITASSRPTRRAALEQAARLEEGFRRRGVTFAGQPMSSFVRPHFVSRADFDVLRAAARRLVEICARVARHGLRRRPLAAPGLPGHSRGRGASRAPRSGRARRRALPGRRLPRAGAAALHRDQQRRARRASATAIAWPSSLRELPVFSRLRGAVRGELSRPRRLASSMRCSRRAEPARGADAHRGHRGLGRGEDPARPGDPGARPSSPAGSRASSPIRGTPNAARAACSLRARARDVVYRRAVLSELVRARSRVAGLPRGVSRAARRCS